MFNPINRPTRTRATAWSMVLIITLGIMPNMAAYADPEIIWYEVDDPQANTYYRSTITGSVIPLRHNDPRFTGAPGQKVVTAVSLGRNREEQTIDEINHLAQLLADRNGALQTIIADRKSMLNRTGSEISSILTQVGSVSNELRDSYYDSLRQVAESQARLEAIGHMYQFIRKTLTREGMEWFSNMARAEQANIDAFIYQMSQMDETIGKAAVIDLFSLGLGRVGSAISKQLAARKLAQEATEAAITTEAAREATEAGLQEAEKQLLTEALKDSAEETTKKLATAAEKKAAADALVDLAETAAGRAETEVGKKVLTEAEKKLASEEAARAIATAEANLAAARAESAALQKAATKAQDAAELATRAETAAATKSQNAAKNVAQGKDALAQLPAEIATQLEVATAEAAAKASGLRTTWKELVRARDAARQALRNATQSGKAEARTAFDAAEAARKKAYDAYVAAREVRDALADSSRDILAARAQDLQAQLARLETEAAKATAAQTAASETANRARDVVAVAEAGVERGANAIRTAAQELFESNANGVYKSAEFVKAASDLLNAELALQQAQRLSTSLRMTAAEAAAAQQALAREMKAAAERLLALLSETSSQTAQTLSQSLGDFARANAELTTAQIQRLSERTITLATEGLERAAAKLATAQEMFEIAQRKLLDAQAARVAAELKLELRFSDPTFEQKRLQALIDLLAAEVGNVTSTLATDFYLYAIKKRLTDEEQKALDEVLKEAAPDLKKQFDELKTGDIAPVDSNQDGTAPVTSDQDPANRPKVADAEPPSPTGSGAGTGESTDNEDIAPITSAKAPTGPPPATTSDPEDNDPKTGEPIAPPPAAEETNDGEGNTGDGTPGQPKPTDGGTRRLPPMLFPDEDPERFSVGNDLGFAFAGSIPGIRVDLDETVMLASANYTADLFPPEESLTGHMSDEERAARVVAIRNFRETPTGRNGTDVALPYLDSPLREMRYRIGEDIKARLQELEDQEASDSPGPRSAEPMETTEPTTPTEPTETTPVTDTNPSTEPPAPVRPSPIVSPFESRVGNLWRPQNPDPESGISNLFIMKEGNQYLLRGMGPNIPLRVEGNNAFGTGGVLFGTGNHDITMAIRGQQIHLEAIHPNGGTWSTMLVRAN